jgi:ADP-heptose:LPS heptosyltransferase
MEESSKSPAASRRAAALAIGRAAHEVLTLGDIPLARHLATLALETSDAEANLHSVMAGVLEAEGRLAEALPCWRRAVACAPDSAGQRYNLALALMRAGEMEEGLRLQEARYDKEKWTSLAAAGSLDGLVHRIPHPGDVLAGKRILVFTEQGLGDCIWAARWLPRLAATGARLALACRAELRELLAPLAPFEEVLTPPPDAPKTKINLAALTGRFDAFLPLMSLPWLMGVARPGPEGVPWLQPDGAEVTAWRQRHEAALPGARLIVGLVWLANPESGSGADRSLPVGALAPLRDLRGIGVVSLQGGEIAARRQLAEVLPQAVDALAARELSLLQLAAAIAATDVLITVDTMAMHLAGSMGHPAIVAVSHHVPGFVLGLEEACGWYPSLALMRRRAEETWEALMRRVTATLSPDTLAPATAARWR